MREIRKREYYELTESELERIINNSLHVNYVIAEGWKRNSVQILYIESKDYDKHAIEQVTNLLQKKSDFCSVESLMLELVARDEIPEGRYLISVY